MLATVQGVIDNVTFAISLVGAVALASGALILIGAVTALFAVLKIAFAAPGGVV